METVFNDKFPEEARTVMRIQLQIEEAEQNAAEKKEEEEEDDEES